MRGRRPKGPGQLVKGLEGDAPQRQRLELILLTLAGKLSIAEACATLAITPQRFHQLREECMQAALENLALRPGGRPSKQTLAHQEQLDALQQENERLRLELQASKLREEIALVLPGRSQQGQGKKKIPTGDAG